MNGGSFNPKYYGKYISPGEYKQEIEKHGYKAPLQFFVAVSNIMKKKKITFKEACKLLGDNGYLIWRGKFAMYDLLGDNLWK
jgi:hypothetical protein